MILTTHSPEMMIAAGSNSLYTVLKQPESEGTNQLVRVTQSDELHAALSDLMGSRGLVSLNQRIVFIEGEEASADRAVYESLYPPSQYNVSFVPAGNSSVVRKTAERVNALLTASTGFQEYYCIVDRDIDRPEADPTSGRRLYRLPAYHIENFLLDPEIIFEVTRTMLGSTCPYQGPEEVEDSLKKLLYCEVHLKPLARSLLDAELARIAHAAYDSVYKNSPLEQIVRPTFEQAEQKARARMEESIASNTWQQDCRGRELLKAYCGEHGFKYEHFRNSLISELKAPPIGLAEIMDEILSD